MNDQKQYEVEWSFSFEKIGESINNMLNTAGEEVKSTTICEQRGSATSLEFHLHPAIGRTHVSSLSGADCLIEGALVYTGEIEFNATGDAQRVVTLKHKAPKELLAPVRQAIGAFNRRADLNWEIGLSPSIPTRLLIHGGVGPSKLDLSGIQLTDLRIDGGVGETKLCLPATEQGYSAVLKGGVGQNTIYVPSNVAVQLHIDGGVGQTSIELAPNTAVRVVAKGGLGAVSVPPQFKQLKKDSDFVSHGGVWETEGFSLSGHQVTIEYKGGVGAFNIAYGDPNCA